MKVTLVFTNRSNLSRGWVGHLVGESTHLSSWYQEAAWASVCLRLDKNAGCGSFSSPGESFPEGRETKIPKLPCLHFPAREYSRQLPKARYAVFQGFTITCCRYISVICCLPGSLLLLFLFLFFLLLLLLFFFPTVH